MKRCVVTLMMLFIASSCFGEWTNVPWDIFYAGNVLPDASGAIKYSDGSSGAFTATSPTNFSINQVYGGIYRMSSISCDLPAYWSKSLVVPAAISPNSATGYTVEIRARLIDAENVIGGCAFSIEEATAGVSRYWVFQLGENADGEVFAGINSTTTPVYIPVDHNWHSYRMAATNSGVSLYIDGDATAANTISAYRTDVSLDNIRFGDMTNTNDGDWEIDYIGIYSSGAVAICSDAAHPYSKGDLNKDCKTDMYDLQIFVGNWLRTN